MRRILDILLICLSLNLQSALLQPPAQTELDPEVEAILAQMSVEDRVGQLFLVTFYGSDVGPESSIYRLITRYRVGGVILVAANDNFTGTGGLVEDTYQLTVALQTVAAERRQFPPTDIPGPPISPGPYVPLLIGVEPEGLAGTYLPSESGLTPMPTNMAIGATWDPAFAEATGTVVGQELAALGVNLLLGPAADVVENPQPFTTGDLGTREFGGEPFWVSRMVTSYVRGVHEGSQGRMLVIPRYFPGHGGADRLATVEIPTIRRSLDQLIQSDLKPFFAVTANLSDPPVVADGLMTGHIKYRGFQGDNPRLDTRPISLDPQALQVLLRLEPVASWRASGGLLMTDALGLRGVRRFYDPQETTFYNRRIAQEAFMAGNDLLYLGAFGNNPPVDQTEAVIDTILFFVQQYEEDPAFQTRVDESVRRILRKKLDLYGTFELENVLPASSDLASLGQQEGVTLSIAQNALTLLSPDQAELLVSPGPDDRIVIITDNRTERRCSTCVEHPLVPVDALQSAILRQYGPEATGLVSLATIQSFSFAQLVDYLTFGLQPASADATPEPNELAIALEQADWIVFVMLDVTPELPSSDAVKRFLASTPVANDPQIVVMALGAPYYLDATEVSKLTAYYALYGYSQPFIDVAARALFQGVPLPGAAPVSVAAANYQILEATAPDPAQIIALTYQIQRAGQPDAGEDAQLAPRQGDTIQLSAGVIVDRNGNAVPDGTPVEFVVNYVNQGLRNSEPLTTTGGVAQLNLLLDRPGELQISAVSPPARNSETIQLVITETGEGTIVVRTPAVPTSTPPPTETPTAPIEGSGVATPVPALPTELPPTSPSVDFADLYLALGGLVALALGVYVFGLRTHDLNYGLLLALPVLVLGLFGYNYYALMLPGAAAWHALMGDAWGPATATWIGGLLGLGGVLVIMRVRSERLNQSLRRP